MSRTSRLAPVLIFAALLAAGCGGSGHTTTAGRTALVAQADPICKQVSLKRTAANEALGKAGYSSKKELEILARVAPPVAADEQQAVERLRTLKAPASLSADWQQMLAGIQELADDAKKIATEAKANNLNGVKSTTASGQQVRQQLTTLAGRLGFSYCGRTS